MAYGGGEAAAGHLNRYLTRKAWKASWGAGIRLYTLNACLSDTSSNKDAPQKRSKASRNGTSNRGPRVRIAEPTVDSRLVQTSKYAYQLLRGLCRSAVRCPLCTASCSTSSPAPDFGPCHKIMPFPPRTGGLLCFSSPQVM